MFFASLLPQSGRVLDLGCGTGTNLRSLHALGHECVGLDQSQSFIDFATQAGPPDIQYVHCRAHEYSPDGQFDLVFAIFVTLNYLHRAELQPLFDKVSGWLRPGGYFVVDIGHMLNFVENYQPFIIAHHEHEGVLITRLIRHFVNPHLANWRHEETLLVRESTGQVQMFSNFFDQMVLTAPELTDRLTSVGLRVVETFSSFRKDPPSRQGRGHLILVAQSGSASRATPRSD